MVLITARRQVSFEDLPSDIFALLRTFGVRTSEYEKIRTAYYGSMKMSPAQVVQFRKETLELRARYFESRKQEVIKQKGVHSRSPATVERIASGLLAEDQWLKKLDAIVEMCDDAIERSDTIVCVGE